MKIQLNRIAIAAFALVTIGAGSNAQAQTTIDQNKALAGNVTPGDAAGFPITLSVAGVYKLTGNLVVPAQTRGIHITADGVTLDLNGYSIAGPVTCNIQASPACIGVLPGFNSGIDSVGQITVIRNGTVRGFAGAGISLTMPGGSIVQDVLVTMNAYSGIQIYSSGAGSLDLGGMRISRVTATQNDNHGIWINGPKPSTINIDNSVANANKGDGFSLAGAAGNHGTLKDLVAEKNTGYGLYVLNSDPYSLLSGSRFLNNAQGTISGTPISGGGNLSGGMLF